MATNVLSEISSSKEDRIRYENEIIFDLDINSKVNKAKLDGKMEGKLEVARKLFGMNVPLEQIIDATGLQREDIQTFQH